MVQNGAPQSSNYAVIPRSRLPISATMLREMMVKDERREWMKWVNPKLHKMYDRLRAELMEVPYYKELQKVLLQSSETA